MYSRIRDALYRTGLKLEDKVPKNDAADDLQNNRLVEVIQEHTEETSEEIDTIEIKQEIIEETNGEILMEQNQSGITSPGLTAQNVTSLCEIEEEGIEDSRREERSHDMDKRKVYISREVEEALGTLEKVIAMVREHGWNAHNRPSLSSDEDSKDQKEAEMEESTPVGGTISSNDKAVTEVLNKDTGERYLDNPRDSSSSHSLR